MLDVRSLGGVLRRFLILTLPLVLGACKAQPEGRGPLTGKSASFCRYTPGSVAAILEALREFALPPGYNFAIDQFPTLARVRYLGMARPVLPIIGHFSNRFDVAVRQEDSLNSLWREVQFEEGRDTIWLPVQEPVLQHLASEAVPGDSITLLVMYLGTFVPSDSSQLRVLIVTEFESARLPWLVEGCRDALQQARAA